MLYFLVDMRTSAEPPLMPAPGTVAAIIVAAGRGLRAGGELPKQYQSLAGEPILARTLRPFLEHPAVSRIHVVIGERDAGLYAEVISGLPQALIARLGQPVIGGDTRQASVRNGLSALEDDAPDIVLVHDAARPFLRPGLISDAITAAQAHGAAIPGFAVTDTIKQVDADGRIRATPPRGSLRAVQTPQGFHFALLAQAHRHALDGGVTDATDDATLVEALGRTVTVFDGDRLNLKITTAADLVEAERRLSVPLVTRLGQGFDVHAFGPGDHVWLGGVRIAHEFGVVAHSDGDVVLHALTDALLGALSDGDIGVHFPPSDPQWRGASSDRFLADACARVRARGGLIDHLDATVISEAPRIGPHRDAIRGRIAGIAGVTADAVAIKATTSERMGFTGRREGLAALAVATIRVPTA